MAGLFDIAQDIKLRGEEDPGEKVGVFTLCAHDLGLSGLIRPEIDVMPVFQKNEGKSRSPASCTENGRFHER